MRDSETLSAAADAVVETALEGEHVENCIRRDGQPGPSPGLPEVGERLEAHADVDLAEQRGAVTTDARRAGDPLLLELVNERER